MSAALDTTTKRARTRDQTRWDIQGLRAFAVLAVVLYHLWPLRLPGGFVGVDVFFVISGYLITGHLLREVTRHGRIKLAQFWARRAKRLLPAAFITILATGAAVLLWVPYSFWDQYGRELIASTVYVQNWQLASDSVDYLASDNKPSPFQHFWSLSVEEQFYIALPVLLIVLLAVLRRTRKQHDPVVTTRVLLGTVVVLSLVWCVVETDTSPGVAYFSTATRAWEFALGGLASTIALPAPRTAVAAGVRTGGAWLGAALLVVSLWTITSATPFPGVAALLPVAGATLIVLLGAGTELESVGRITPIAHLGRISYSVYLWHWPAVVLVPIITQHTLTTGEKLLIGFGAIVVGSASTLLVEEPLRFSDLFRRMRPRRVAVFGVVASVVVLALGATTFAGLNAQEVRAAAFTKQLERGDVQCFGAAAKVGFDEPCVNPELADVRAIGGPQDANRGACWSSGPADFNLCTLGPESGYRKHFVALGDSHSNALIDVYEQIAKRNDWRIDVAGHSSCYFTAAPQQAASEGMLAGCNGWKQNAMDWVDQHPDLDGVLVTHSASTRPVDGDQATVDGLVEAWKHATDNGVPVIAIRDNPVPEPDVVACVQQMTGKTDDSCDQTRTAGFAAFDGQAQAVAQMGGKAALVDMSKYYCTATSCPAVIGGVGVYRDTTHITNSFAKTMRPFLEMRIKKALQSF